MYAFLVVFHGADIKNKWFNTRNCTVCQFSVGITTLEALLGLNRGGGGMLDLELIFGLFEIKMAPFTPAFLTPDLINASNKINEELEPVEKGPLRYAGP